MTGRYDIAYKTFMCRTALRRCVELCFELMSNEASRLSRTMLRRCLELCFQMLSSVDCENRRLCSTAGVGYNRPVRAVYYRVGMPTITPPYCVELSLRTVGRDSSRYRLRSAAATQTNRRNERPVPSPIACGYITADTPAR